MSSGKIFNYQLLLFVFIGSGLGGVSRLLLSRFFAQYFPGFPFGTLTANLSGMFLIGFFSILIIEKSLIGSPYREMIIVGFLGGLTTFSSFGYETYTLFRENRFDLLFYYLAGNLLIGFLLLLTGRHIGRML